jgi:hypothetical protein
MARSIPTQRQRKVAKQRPERATVVPDQQPPANTYETFQVGDCGSMLPASDVVHEVSFDEFKELRRTINDLPYPVILAATAVPLFSQLAIPSVAKAAQSAATGVVRYVDLLGGVPAERALEKHLGDLVKPAIVDARVPNVDALLARANGNTNIRVGGKSLRVSLDEAARANLSRGRPAIISSSGATKQLVRLIPGRPTTLPTNEHIIGDLPGFLARPRLTTNRGTEVPLRLSATQIRELRTWGSTTVGLGGQRLALRSAPAGTSASYAATAVNVSEGLESTGTRTSAPADQQSLLVEDDDPASEYNLPLILFLPWKQEWKLQGYTRGQLVQSLTLAPQEETTIEISTWDRRKRTTEDAVTSDVEQASEVSQTDKDVLAVLNETKNDNQFNIDARFSVGWKVADTMNLDAGSTMGFKTDVANSSKTSLDHLSESVRKASMKLKIERQTKVSESSEIGRDDKVTRRVRNPNMCHSLTLNYFETLAHYYISTKLERLGARLCVLVRNPYGTRFEFTQQNIRIYEGVLRRVLLQPELAGGFAAAHKLVAVDNIPAALIAVNRELPPQNTTSPEVRAALEETQSSLQAVLTAFTTVSTATIRPNPNPQPLNPFVKDLTDDQRRRVFYDRRLAERRLTLYQTLIELRTAYPPASGSSPATSTEADLQTLARAITAAAPLIEISPAQMNMPPTELHRIYEIAWSIYAPPGMFAWSPGDEWLKVDDAGLHSALDTFGKSYASWDQARKLDAGAKAAGRAHMGTSYSVKEVAEALEQVEALITHLNEYKTYYRGALLRLMPLDDGLMNRISAFGNIVERRVLGEYRGRVVVPIRADMDPRTKPLFEQLVSGNELLYEIADGFPITMPTPGLHIETRLGTCDACEEYIDQIRRLDLRAKDAEIDLKRETLAQQKLETARMEHRIKAKDYADPIARPPVLRLELEPPPAPTPKKPADQAPNS